MDDLVKIIGALVGGGLVFTVAHIVGKVVWKAIQNYRGWRHEIVATQAQALAAITQQRNELLITVKQLKEDLRLKQRTIEEKDDIGSQDRAHIRLLKNRLKDSDIDFDDIEEQIRRFFNGNSSK